MEAFALRLEAIASRLEAIALRLEAIASRLEAIASRLEAIALRLEAIALRLEAIASRLEAIALRFWRPVYFSSPPCASERVSDVHLPCLSLFYLFQCVQKTGLIHFTCTHFSHSVCLQQCFMLMSFGWDSSNVPTDYH